MTFEKTKRDKCLRTLQLMELDILKELDRICRKHNIKYSLGGGTCLGQLRHGGFIPWDDDIDVDMTIENYEKFVSVVESELDHNKFFFRSKKTDKRTLRTSSRIELINTHMLQKRWEDNNKDIGVFVDIFSWSYLPSNKFLRRIVASNLFYIRCIQNYKEFKGIPRKTTTFSKPIIYLCSFIFPNCILSSVENKLRHCVKKKNAKWILDDALINGNHGGYPIDGIDEYEDVTFDGITVMNKKNPYKFMETIYGKDYMEWLEPIKRITHHRWTKVSFGPYVEKYNLPSNYNDYISILYTPEKLQHMQKISFNMVDYVKDICNKNKIKYYIADENCLYKEKDIDDYGSVWKKPIVLAFPRKDYESICKILEKNDNDMYFIQNERTEKNYHYGFSKLMLNCTALRDNDIPIEFDAKIYNGFYISLIPLDYAPNNIKQHNSFRNKVKKSNIKVGIKWRKCNLRGIKGSSISLKLSIFAMFFANIKRLKKRYNNLINKYKDTSYYIDSTGNLNYKIINVSAFGNGKEESYNGHKFVFPTNLNEFNKEVHDSNYINKIEHISFIKKSSPKYYSDKYINNISKECIEQIQKRFAACYLNYFDMEDYQLTVLRYDNKKDKLLTNDEILKAYRDLKNN